MRSQIFFALWAVSYTAFTIVAVCPAPIEYQETAPVRSRSCGLCRYDYLAKIPQELGGGFHNVSITRAGSCREKIWYDPDNPGDIQYNRPPDYRKFAIPFFWVFGSILIAVLAFDRLQGNVRDDRDAELRLLISLVSCASFALAFSVAIFVSNRPWYAIIPEIDYDCVCLVNKTPGAACCQSCRYFSASPPSLNARKEVFDSRSFGISRRYFYYYAISNIIATMIGISHFTIERVRRIFW